MPRSSQKPSQMTEVRIASFNVKNLIGPNQEYYKFQSYSTEEHAWKQDWLADQILALGSDVVGFQEIFDETALRDVIAETDRRGAALNDVSQPNGGKARRAIFRNIKYQGYQNASLAFAPNLNDGPPGERRPGLAILSRFGFVGTPEIIQDLDEPVEISLDGGGFRLDRTSRPILKARVQMGTHLVTIINCHLKSKLGEFQRDETGIAPEADLTRYDPIGRAMGAARAALRRMAEAWVVRREVVRELDAGNPVIVLGDFNDGEHAVSSEIISGETPFKNYAWMLRHDAQSGRDRYSDAENLTIREAIEAVRLHSAEKLFVRKSLRDMVYTSAFGGVYESIDQIFLSRHFLAESSNTIGEMSYFSVLNDHLTDGAHPEAPYNKLASDHGQIMATLILAGQ